MLDDILELVIQIVYDTIDIMTSFSKIPLPIRIIVLSLISIPILAVCGFVLYAGIDANDMIMTIIGGGLILAYIIFIVCKIWQGKKKNN